MKKSRRSLVAASLFLGVPVTLAHHSFAMFDLGREVTVEGVTKELQFTNPHVWIQLMVPDGKGGETEWSIEGGSPNSLSRNGWRSTTFKPGDLVTVRLNPMKDGTPAGGFVAAKFADGKTIGRWE